MTTVIKSLPHDFNRSESPATPSKYHAELACPRGVPSDTAETLPNVQVAVDKFNRAFPLFAIHHPDRSALAVMKKYAALCGNTDLENELEYHLAKPLDANLACKVRM